jgi:hypothetical protein
VPTGKPLAPSAQTAILEFLAGLLRKDDRVKAWVARKKKLGEYRCHQAALTQKNFKRFVLCALSGTQLNVPKFLF